MAALTQVLLEVTGLILFLALLPLLEAVVVNNLVELVDVMAVPAGVVRDYF
jgi:hypothetical protein